MRKSPPLLLRIASLLAAALLLPAAVAAQEPEEPEPRETEAEPTRAATLPAEVLAYGVALEKQAQRMLLDWSQKYARELLRDEFSADELTAERIAKLFPAQSPPTQEAIRFLVGYEAYRRASREQETHASTLRDIGRAMRRVEDRIRFLENFQQPIGTLAERQREISLSQARYDMEQLQIRHTLAANAEKIEAARVDACLRWLAEAHLRVKDTPAGVLRSVPPPRS